jgi:hypothetical protein
MAARLAVAWAALKEIWLVGLKELSQVELTAARMVEPVAEKTAAETAATRVVWKENLLVDWMVDCSV